MKLEELVEQLTARAASGDDLARIVTADEVDEWPEGALDDLLRDGLLIRVQPAETVDCHACFEDHAEPVQIVEEPPGTAKRFYIACPTAGRVAVDPSRQRRWQLVATALLSGRHSGPLVTQMPSGPFDHTEDYRWVKLNDLEFQLTEGQAEVVEILHKAYLAGKPDLAWGRVASKLKKTSPASMSEVFKGEPRWQELIAKRKRDLYRLDIPS